MGVASGVFVAVLVGEEGTPVAVEVFVKVGILVCVGVLVNDGPAELVGVCVNVLVAEGVMGAPVPNVTSS